MHGSESTAARSCKFIFRAGPRVAPLRGSTSPPAFESGYKILEGEGVGPIGQTRAWKIGKLTKLKGDHFDGAMLLLIE